MSAGIRIGNNIQSLQAQRQLTRNSEALANIFERLSSGQRINKASDDAAGLSISTSLNADARVFSQGVRNLNDGISLLNIADGALGQLSSIIQRQLELSEQAANGSYSSQQRFALNTEINALSTEYNRILSSSTFNGINIFSDQMRTSGLSLQVGYGTNGMLSAYIGEEGSRDVGDGTFSTYSTAATGFGYVTQLEAADFNGDGILDLISSNDGSGQIRVALGNSDGTFAAGLEIANTGAANGYLRVGDFNGDGREDFAVTSAGGRLSIFTGDGDGTFTLGMTYTDATFGNNGFDVADINGDGRDDIVQAGVGAGRIYLGNANGTFSVSATFSTTYGSGSSTVKILRDSISGSYSAVFIAAGVGISVIDLGSDGSAQNTTQTFAGAPAGGQLGVGDFNGDGIGDFIAMNNGANAYRVYLGNGNGTFRAGGSLSTVTGGGYPGTSARIADLNGDGVLDLIQTSSSGLIAFLGNGDGTFASGITSSAPGNTSTLAIGDFNGDGVLDIASNDGTFGSGNLKITTGDITQTLNTKLFDITTQESALEALTFLNQQLARVSLERGSIGAFMARINTAISTTLTARDNFLAAASRITDTDVAVDSAELIRLNILQQAGAAVLAQANQQPALALRLLNNGGG